VFTGFLLTSTEIGVFGGLFQITTLYNVGNESIGMTLIDFCFHPVFCEEVEKLPVIIEFNNLHLTDTVNEIKSTLKGATGIYCFKNTITGAIYIGSAIDISKRFMGHIFYNFSNTHLQRAIALYGLPVFLFIVIEFSHSSVLIAREQF